MPLDIDGAGRSRSLACLPTARGTVAPTRGQVMEEGLGGRLLFLRWILRGSGVHSASEFQDQGPSESQEAGSAAPNFSPHRHSSSRSLQGLQPPQRGVLGPAGACKPSRNLRALSSFNNLKVYFGVLGRPSRVSGGVCTAVQEPQGRFRNHLTSSRNLQRPPRDLDLSASQNLQRKMKAVVVDQNGPN